MKEHAKRMHLIAKSGIALCGMPAKEGQLGHWGEADCQHCIALYSQRVRGLAH